MAELAFLKLGGSLITDKDLPYTPRLDKLNVLAQEIKAALCSDRLAGSQKQTELKLILGHGSGSFGHTAGKKYGTRNGVHTPEEWAGFAEVRFQAAELNRHVMEALFKTGIPALSFPPSATIISRDGKVASYETAAIRMAMTNNILPVVYGDVVFDEIRGGTILSTEDVFGYLARELHPQRILLAGLEAGVWEDFPARTRLVHAISSKSYEEMRKGIGKSASADVTGGMASKVEEMLNLVQQVDGLTVQIFSAEDAGNLTRVIEGDLVGTLVQRK
jgi:isopentenyl phosphate kinase